MYRLVRRRSEKTGLPAGEPVLVGEPQPDEVRVTIVGYDERGHEVTGGRSIEDIRAALGRHGAVWVHVEGLRDIALIDAIGAQFGIHPLIVEDILNTEQHPKIDVFDEYIFLDLNLHEFCRDESCIEVEQISMVLGRDHLITFQERRSGLFEPVRARLASGADRMRKEGTDFLAYALVDLIVDHYFGVLERVGEQVEDLEDSLVTDPGPETLQDIHFLKRELIFLRRSVWPLRDIISRLLRGESGLIRQSTHIYLRDVYDHAVQVLDTIETHRDMVSGMLDIYLTSLSNRMNEVMKFLTIIGTIFIPLTFIAGVYGMNFQHMPELGWRWGYFGVLGVMAAVGASLLLYFKKKGWM